MFSIIYPASKKHFTDKQIANMIPNYFYREHNSPNIKRIRVYGKDNEKYLHIEIDVNRNRYHGEADFTLYAMADITQYAKIPFDKFIIIMTVLIIICFNVEKCKNRKKSKNDFYRCYNT